MPPTFSKLTLCYSFMLLYTYNVSICIWVSIHLKNGGTVLLDCIKFSKF